MFDSKVKDLLNEDVKYIVVIKDIYSWLISIQSWAKKCQWDTVKDEIVNDIFIDDYISFYNKWLQFKRESDNIIFIRYGDLLRDNVGPTLSIFLQKEYILRKLQSKVPQSTKFTKIEYYLNKEYMKKYTESDLKQIESKLKGSSVSTFLNLMTRK